MELRLRPVACCEGIGLVRQEDQLDIRMVELDPATGQRVPGNQPVDIAIDLEATALMHGREAADKAEATARTTFEQGGTAQDLPK